MEIEKYKKEIEELHRFFVEWYTGILKNSEEHFSRFKDVMAGTVHFVGTDGSVADKNDLLNWIKQAWAGYATGEFNIKIKEFKLMHETKETALVSYQEWQNFRGKTLILVSSVLLSKTENRYNNLEWQHIHVSEKK